MNIAATMFTFLVGAIGFYFVLDLVLTRQLDRSLFVEEQEITKYVTEHGKLPYIPDTKHQWITIDSAREIIRQPKAENANAFNSAEGEAEPIRKLVFSIGAGGKNYQVTVNQSKTEKEDLLQLIIIVTTGMIALLLLLNYFINRRLIGSLWKPFYDTLDKIRRHQVSVQEPIHVTKTGIDEIDLLNDDLHKMTQRINDDYVVLKTFTENASHEMQTPLAVIRSKTENLLQYAEQNKDLMQQVLAIEAAATRLSKLHQSLLLLTKLENRQFTIQEPVNLDAVVKEKLQEKEELFAENKIEMVVITEPVFLNFHSHLAEILVNNLLSNAIRYTPKGGVVEIRLGHDHLTIRNSANGGTLDTHRVFQRFYKEHVSTDNTGLGLAIVKEICVVAGFTPLYAFQGGKHCFSIQFSK